MSEDGSTAYATVSYKVAAGDLTDADKAALESAVDEVRDAGLTVETGGTALATQPTRAGREAIGIGLAAVVLLITFGSVAAAGLPCSPPSSASGSACARSSPSAAPSACR